ncbi:MAG: Stp1/IreP family PP2C-type Ser/Thr phosphatase [Acidobacteria bacterium]|nr:Stp1/IreP family PP2C-type Ser/Thr phosphatase [Acidobacteriota bacterium]
MSTTATPQLLKVTVACRTDKGRVRAVNEDNFIIFDLNETDISRRTDALIDYPVSGRGLLLAVADGMGGAQAGEVASQLATEQLARRLSAPVQRDEPSERLSDGLKSANHAIRHASQENHSYQGMGSTMTAALIYEGQAIIGEVGDSRGYLIRNDLAKQITKDQSLAQALIDVGALTEEQAAHSRQRHIVLQALGTQDEVEPVMSVITLENGDYLLLCSDYLANKVNAVEISDIVKGAQTLDDACEQLVARANDQGGEDNITVLIARLDREVLSA